MPVSEPPKSRIVLISRPADVPINGFLFAIRVDVGVAGAIGGSRHVRYPWFATQGFPRSIPASYFCSTFFAIYGVFCVTCRDVSVCLAKLCVGVHAKEGNKKRVEGVAIAIKASRRSLFISS